LDRGRNFIAVIIADGAQNAIKPPACGRVQCGGARFQQLLELEVANIF
jgi:hypothetical protein